MLKNCSIYGLLKIEFGSYFGTWVGIVYSNKNLPPSHHSTSYEISNQLYPECKYVELLK
jgi:hypothetical protein